MTDWLVDVCVCDGKTLIGVVIGLVRGRSSSTSRGGRRRSISSRVYMTAASRRMAGRLTMSSFARMLRMLRRGIREVRLFARGEGLSFYIVTDMSQTS